MGASLFLTTTFFVFVSFFCLCHLFVFDFVFVFVSAHITVKTSARCILPGGGGAGGDSLQWRPPCLLQQQAGNRYIKYITNMKISNISMLSHTNRQGMDISNIS